MQTLIQPTDAQAGQTHANIKTAYRCAGWSETTGKHYYSLPMRRLVRNMQTLIQPTDAQAGQTHANLNTAYRCAGWSDTCKH
ncbi:hypothetical protein DPMN_101374 [Dreissena polymorpha]|uniref:Uncharacterized protein n=1 Tax=Dreissena polymorpha TaxID=45954 RepID=A0A9D4LIM3_DREPO|nr:hypothetical protein DPMN_101374 [Dreissena polymorpha]